MLEAGRNRSTTGIVGEYILHSTSEDLNDHIAIYRSTVHQAMLAKLMGGRAPDWPEWIDAEDEFSLELKMLAEFRHHQLRGDESFTEAFSFTAKGRQYNPDELQAAFSEVADKKDWKRPIAHRKAFRPEEIWGLCDELLEWVSVTTCAIRYMTATEPQFSLVCRVTESDWVIQVESAGYRAGPAGDH